MAGAAPARHEWRRHWPAPRTAGAGQGEPLLLQGVPATSPPRLLAVVGRLGELAGGVTKDRTTDRQAAGEGIVADKPWRIDVRIGLDRKVLNFCDGIHGECAAGLRRRAGGVL